MKQELNTYLAIVPLFAVQSDVFQAQLYGSMGEGTKMSLELKISLHKHLHFEKLILCYI